MYVEITFYYFSHEAICFEFYGTYAGVKMGQNKFVSNFWKMLNFGEKNFNRILMK